jgi:hypothetical protein
VPIRQPLARPCSRIALEHGVAAGRAVERRPRREREHLECVAMHAMAAGGGSGGSQRVCKYELRPRCSPGPSPSLLASAFLGDRAAVVADGEIDDDRVHQRLRRRRIRILDEQRQRAGIAGSAEPRSGGAGAGAIGGVERRDRRVIDERQARHRDRRHSGAQVDGMEGDLAEPGGRRPRSAWPSESGSFSSMPLLLDARPDGIPHARGRA